MDRGRPDLGVKAAACASVDRAEDEPALAQTVNGQAPAVLAETATRCGCWLVHYSTDYVFDGSGHRPWREGDPRGPLGVYGRTKLAGEQAVAMHARHLILRTSWVYSLTGACFLRTILRAAQQRDRLEVVDDQVGAPTGADLIADVTAQLLRELRGREQDEVAGTYHLAPRGAVSWCGYARHVITRARSAGIPLRVADDAVHPVPSSAWPTRAVRPLNSRLDVERIEATFGLRMPDWQHGVDDVIDALARLQEAAAGA